MRLVLLVASIILSNAVWAQEVVPTVVIEEEEKQGSPIDSFSTFKSEKVSSEKLKEPARQTLADLVKDQVGVDTQTYCANCGAKRLTINGLKGEHTSILVDGLPLHSAVSSFYGVDSVPVNGIQEIEVMRGAGASLTNPEAIGGTLNLVTIDPLTARQSYATSVTINDEFEGTGQNHSVLVSLPTKSKKFGISFGGQFADMQSWDEDENNVAESPFRENYSGLIKTRFLLGSKNDISLRVGLSELTILGGAANATKPNQVRPIPAQEADFINGSVEEEFIGDPLRITDWVNLKRYEGAAQWTSYWGSSTTFNFNVGYARQEQQAIYQHGFDYAHNDNMVVGDTNIQMLLGDSHVFKVGLFHKTQMLRSTSEVLFNTLNIPKDNFDFTSNAPYIQDTWIINESLEMDLALRADQVNINWTELTNEIDEWVLAPRFQLRHDITDHLSQRLSYGLGYRAPLTFFESQHGNNENGYQIDITDLEKADSIVYSISQNTPDYYVTAGVHYTRLKNMAFGFETQGQPILYRNTDEAYEIWASDLLIGYKVKPWWMLEASAEFFTYEDGYTAKLPTAAIERRFQLRSNIDTNNWQHTFAITMVGSRDLSRYGEYRNHFVDRNQFPTPEQIGDEQKDQKAPTFFTVDTALIYKLKQNYSLVFGINNIFDYTQTGSANDSPSTWHWHFDHAHYDALHTWGPNRGREFFFKLAADW